MKVNGKVLISKKYQTDEPDFNRTEKVGWGRLSWMNKIGDSYTYTNKAFCVFKDNIDIVANNLDKILFIEGTLRTETYKDGEGVDRKTEKVIIDKVVVYENVQPQKESIAQINKMISNNKDKAIDHNINIQDLEDNIPF